MQLQSPSYIVEHGHWKRGRFLEYHPYLSSQLKDVNGRRQDVDTIHENLTGGSLIAVEFENPVIDTYMGGLAASGGSNDRRDLIGYDIQFIGMKGLMIAIEEVEVSHRNFDPSFQVFVL